jgi:hypothetical protein
MHDEVRVLGVVIAVLGGERHLGTLLRLIDEHQLTTAVWNGSAKPGTTTSREVTW